MILHLGQRWVLLVFQRFGFSAALLEDPAQVLAALPSPLQPPVIARSGTSLFPSATWHHLKGNLLFPLPCGPGASSPLHFSPSWLGTPAPKVLLHPFVLVAPGDRTMLME